MKRESEIYVLDMIKNVELICHPSTPEVVKLTVQGVCYGKKSGLPKLLSKTHTATLNHDGLLELYFKIIPTEIRERGYLEFKLDSVYHLGKLPAGIKGFKIIAMRNADIVLL